MTTRRAIARAGLVLALAVLSPASALADAGGYRPTKGTGSSMIRLNTKTLHFTADGTGFMTHLARYSVHFDGQARPIRSTPPNKVAVAAEGTMTLAAANGDELYGVFKLTTEDFVLGAGHKDTLEITITGGSGRFESADGTLEATSQIGPGTFVDEDEVTWMVSRSEDTITGQISYEEVRARRQGALPWESPPSPVRLASSGELRGPATRQRPRLRADAPESRIPLSSGCTQQGRAHEPMAVRGRGRLLRPARPLPGPVGRSVRQQAGVRRRTSCEFVIQTAIVPEG